MIGNLKCFSMVSELKKDGAYKYGHEYASITLVGNYVLITLNIEPVNKNATGKPANSPSPRK